GRLTVLGLEHEDLAREVFAGVQAADEGADAAAGELLDRGCELGLGGVLEEQAVVADALVLAHRDQPSLDRRQRLLERDDELVGAGPLGARARRAAAELLLVEPDDRVGDGSKDLLVELRGGPHGTRIAPAARRLTPPRLSQD